jgi:hypothetical protein
LEESVAECDFIDARHGRVLGKLRVDVEEDGHVHLLVRVQPLLLKAETLDLVKVLASLRYKSTLVSNNQPPGEKKQKQTSKGMTL